MKRTCFLIFMAFFLSIAVHGQKMEMVHLDSKNSKTNLYLIIYPPDLPWSGFMFLIPGMGESPEDVLLHTPIMLFTEPDINWWINERNYDLSYSNSYDCAAMINELKLLGNDEAILILTENIRYRKPDNRKHPHSWSIADPTELSNWLLSRK